MFFMLMLRLASLPMTISSSALILELVGSAELDFVLVERDLGAAPFEVEAIGEFLLRLIYRVLDLHRTDLRNNVE
jgi:hypothetical protein